MADSDADRIRDNRELVQAQFDHYLDLMMDFARDRLANGLILGTIVKTQLHRIKQDMEVERDAVLDYAAALAVDPDADRDQYRSRFLAHNPFLKYFNGDDTTRQELEEELTAHFADVAEDLVPLLTADGESFPELMRDAYSHEEGERVLTQNFEQAETIEQFADDLDITFGGFTVISFRDDVLPAIHDGEDALREQMMQDLDKIYDD